MQSLSIDPHVSRMMVGAAASAPKVAFAAPHGFNNLGANCWFNSMLQSLLCCESFVNTLLTHRDTFKMNRLGKILVEMLDMPATARASYPQKLLVEFHTMAKSQGKTIDVFSQEGCQNGFTVFMELLNSVEINDIFINKSHCEITCQSCKTRFPSESHEFSIQVTKDFKVPLVKDGAPRSFNDWIKARISLVDEWKCEKCGYKSKNLVRYETIATLRDIIMVFVVDRSHETYPETLEFPGKSGGVLKYRLVAGIEHLGNLNPVTYSSSGHYKCHGLRGNRYYIFNDSSVIPASSIPTQHCNVIVYHKV